MSDDRTRLERWRLLLGGPAQDELNVPLGADDAQMDELLSDLYESTLSAGLGRSAPRVARWLGDVRERFPRSVVRVLQRDAFERLGLRQMLLEPELLETVEADVHLVATLIELGRLMPERTKETARAVVRKVVDELLAKLADSTRQAVSGALDRAARTRRPRFADIDWDRTIRANLRHYQPELRTIVPETRIGRARKRRSTSLEVVLCVDQSGSMAPSVVYSSIFAAVLASLPTLSTKLVVFDTAVVDLTDQLEDPVDVLFGVQLGGGTDIEQAIGYCQGLVRNPQDTVLVLVSDLCEGGDRNRLLERVRTLIASGVRVVALLALSDQGAPWYDHSNAAAFAALGAPTFACTPDHFPDLMAAALDGRDVGEWATATGLVTARAGE